MDRVEIDNSSPLVIISPEYLEKKYGVVSKDPELPNTDTLLYRDFQSLHLARNRERLIHGTPEVIPYEYIPVTYYDYEKEHRHIARNNQVLEIIKSGLFNEKSSEDFTVVEVGAGVGRFGEKLIEVFDTGNIDKPHLIYYPSDISLEAIKAMKEKGLMPARVSATHLPYLKNSTDVVYAGEVIEHLTFPMFLQFLSETKRILKDDGTLIITTPNFNSLPAREEKDKGIIPFNFDEQRNSWATEHVMPFTLDSYKEILTRFGFEVESISTNNITWKVVEGVPTDFTVYEKSEDVPDPEKGDTLIISARKVSNVSKRIGAEKREDPLIERFNNANKGRDRRIYDRSMNAATEAKHDSIGSEMPLVNEGDIIVDAGGGTGELAEMFAREYRGAKVIDEDISGEEMERASEDRALTSIVYGDASIQNFPENSIKVKYFSTVGHEIESFGGKGRMKQAVENTLIELVPGGRIIIRDFIKPSGSKPIYMKINENDGFDNPNDATVNGVLDYNLLSTRALLERFKLEFNGGNAFEYETVNVNDEELIKIDPEWAYEFYMRKDYTGNWRQEIKEKYSYWTEDEARKILEEAGYIDVQVKPEYQPYIMKNRLIGKIELFNVADNGELESIEFPPTHMVVRGDKPGEPISGQIEVPVVNYSKIKETINFNLENGTILIDEKIFQIDEEKIPVKGSKKQVFWLEGEPKRVLKIVRKDTINEHAVFKALYQSIERENVLEKYEVPHMKVLEKDPKGPPYRYFVQEAIPEGALCAADLIADGSLTENDIKQMANHINNFELSKTWQLDTNPFNWYRVKDKNGEEKMYYIDGKVYRYDENWEFKRIGLLQWLKPDYVNGASGRTVLIPKATEYEEMEESWDKLNSDVAQWWKKYLNPLLQPQTTNS